MDPTATPSPAQLPFAKALALTFLMTFLLLIATAESLQRSYFEARFLQALEHNDQEAVKTALQSKQIQPQAVAGNSALEHAVARENPGMVSFLLQQEVFQGSSERSLALQMAVRTVSPLMVKLIFMHEKALLASESEHLLRFMFTSGARTRRNSTIDTREARHELLALFLDKGAPPRGGNDLLLRLAAVKGDTEAISLLLRHGLDPNATDSLDMTSLHCAAETGATAPIRLLMMKGADRTRKNRAGKTPYDLAAWNANLQPPRTTELYLPALQLLAIPEPMERRQ
jgi:ankyrin repeat protein